MRADSRDAEDLVQGALVLDGLREGRYGVVEDVGIDDDGQGQAQTRHLGQGHVPAHTCTTAKSKQRVKRALWMLSGGAGWAMRSRPLLRSADLRRVSRRRALPSTWQPSWCPPSPPPSPAGRQTAPPAAKPEGGVGQQHRTSVICCCHPAMACEFLCACLVLELGACERHADHGEQRQVAVVRR